MTGHGAKFGRKMERAISALLTRPNIEDAARVAGLGEKTLRRWMREPHFNAEYLRARREGVPYEILASIGAGGMERCTRRVNIQRAT
jgi:hypothetical protein